MSGAERLCRILRNDSGKRSLCPVSLVADAGVVRRLGRGAARTPLSQSDLSVYVRITLVRLVRTHQQYTARAHGRHARRM